MADLFSLRPNGADEFVERYSYRTSLQVARDRTEQRRRLRAHPVGGFEFSFLGRPGTDAQIVTRILADTPGAAWWAPWWPYATPLATPTEIGDVLIGVPTADVPWTAPTGALRAVALWLDSETWAVYPVIEVDSGTLAIDGVIDRVWPISTTLVVPVVRGWAAPEQRIEWPSFEVVTGRVAFDLEVTGEVTVPLEAAPEVPVFDALQPVRSSAIVEQIFRTVSTLDPKLGARVSFREDDAARRLRTFRWLLVGRAQIATMRAFLDGRAGRAIPFWFPSWQSDVTLAADASSGATAITTRAFGYATYLFPGSAAYRRLYFLSPDEATSFAATITAAIDNGDGTETLTLEGPGLGANVTAEWSVMFLRHCRLESDDVEIRWRGPELATVEIGVREIPEEAATL